MNRAIFIDPCNAHTPIECVTIREAQDRIRDLTNRIELEIGTLDIGDDIGIIVDVKHLHFLTEAIVDSVHEIEHAYADLLDKGIARAGTAELPPQL